MLGPTKEGSTPINPEQRFNIPFNVSMCLSTGRKLLPNPITKEFDYQDPVTGLIYKRRFFGMMGDEREAVLFCDGKGGKVLLEGHAWGPLTRFPVQFGRIFRAYPGFVRGMKEDAIEVDGARYQISQVEVGENGWRGTDSLYVGENGSAKRLGTGGFLYRVSQG